MTGPGTIDVECPSCGKVRTLVGARWELPELAARVCRGCASSVARAEIGERAWEVDRVVVQRLVDGRPVTSNPAERREAVAKLTTHGLGKVRIAKLIGVSERTVERMQKVLREQREAA